MIEIWILFILWTFASAGIGFYLGRVCGLSSRPQAFAPERRKQLDALMARSARMAR